MSSLLGDWAELSPVCSGVCAKSEPGTARAATVRAAIVQRLKRVEIITVRLAPGFYGSSRMRTEAAASRSATMPLLAFNRKDSGGESIGRYRLQVADFASTTRKRFHCGGIVAG